MIVRRLLTQWKFDVDSRALDRVNQGIDRVKTNLTRIGIAATAVGGSLFGLAKTTANFGDELAKTSRSLGITAEQLQILRFAFEQGGQNAEILSSILPAFQRRLVLFREQGTGPAKRGLELLNETQRQSILDANNSFDAFLAVQDAIRDLGDEQKAAAVLQSLFNEQARRAVDSFQQGSEETLRQGEALRQLGGIIDADAARAGEDFNEILNLLIKGFRGLRLAVGAQLLRPMQEMISGLIEFLKTNREIVKQNLEGVVFGLVDAFKVFAAVLSPIVEIVRTLTNALGGARNAVRLLTLGFLLFTGVGIVSGLSTLASGLIGITAGLAGVTVASRAARIALFGWLIAGIALLEDFVAFFQGRSSLIGLIGERLARAFTELQDIIMEKFQPVFDLFDSIVSKIEKIAESLGLVEEGREARVDVTRRFVTEGAGAMEGAIRGAQEMRAGVSGIPLQQIRREDRRTFQNQVNVTVEGGGSPEETGNRVAQKVREVMDEENRRSFRDVVNNLDF